MTPTAADPQTSAATPATPDAFDEAPALLVRPDGYIAWAGSDAAGLAEALHRWFGAPDLA